MQNGKNISILAVLCALIAMHTIKFNLNISHELQSFAHFAVFAICALIARHLNIHILFVLLTAICLELSQLLTSRSFEMIDLCSDLIGVYLAETVHNYLLTFKQTN